MKRILFVEDDPLMLEDLQSLVDWPAAGYQVFTAIHGKQGLARWREWQPEIIVTDIKMPLMDGLEMMQLIHEENPYVCFMILSSYEDYNYMREALQLGAGDYILKTSISGPELLGKTEALWASWEEKLWQARAVAKERFRALCEGESKGTAELESLRQLCACFPRTDILPELCREAERLLHRRFHEDERFFQEAADLLSLDARDPIAAVVDYLHFHYTEPELSNSELARMARLSDRQFTTRFRDYTGRSPGDYINMLRMEQAKRLLEGGTMIYEAAERLGYSSPQYFSVAFKAYTGQTPSEYRAGGKK